MPTRSGFLVAALLVSLVAAVGCGQQEPRIAPSGEVREERGRGPESRQQGEPGAAVEAGRDILETAQAAGEFTSLLAAVRAAELVRTLKAEGPFTVFAPTDEAFNKLPEGTLDDLLNKLENRDKLASILTYHVVPGKYMAADVLTMNSAPTVNGKDLTITVEDGKVMVDGATVTQTDIVASNGVIHVIDSVLMP
ncbi:MAG: fasciclin domain-containing protein [Armatimonadetes bacterium]|nr:fasciclin domain-containing protein [Armatimonadota bacterium]